MSENKEVRLAGMLHESLVNGPGIRRVLFAQGCKHQCEGCFNVSTHSFHGGVLKDMDEIIEEISGNPLLRGVTFSGGDPWEQASEFAYMAKNIKIFKKDVWCYTGYTYEYIIENQEKRNGWQELLHSIDVLVDGKFEVDKKQPNLKFRGSTNQRIIDIKESLKAGKVTMLKLD